MKQLIKKGVPISKMLGNMRGDKSKGSKGGRGAVMARRNKTIPVTLAKIG